MSGEPVADARAVELEKQHLDHLRNIFLGLIEVLDGFDRLEAAATEAAPGDEARRWIVRFGKVRKRVENLLAQERVQKVGYEQLQEELHEVVDVAPAGDRPPDSIVEVQVPCYVWFPDGNMRALRKAQVVVAVAPESGGSTPGSCPEGQAGG